MRKTLLTALLLLISFVLVPAPPVGAEDAWKQLPALAPLPEAKQSGYAPVNGIELYYAIYGEGPPLILLHGGLGNSEYFGSQIPVFAKQYTRHRRRQPRPWPLGRDAKPYSYGLIASDLVRPHGLSENPEGLDHGLE